MTDKFALVVPALRDGGGVPAVADFIYRVALDAGWQVQLISLSSSRCDHTSRAILKPTTWMVGPQAETGVWESRPIIHIGSDWAEIEFLRYRMRSLLTSHIQSCRFIQIVSGSAAWAHCALGLGKPVSLQVATRAVEERKMRNEMQTGPMRYWRSAMTRITDKMEKSALKKVDAIQVENHWMLQYVRAETDRLQQTIDLRFAPPGVDTDQFVYAPYPRPTSEPFILCVGRMGDPRKNASNLLEAFALAAQQLPGLSLLTAGVSPPPNEYFERAAALGLSNRVRHVDSPSSAEMVSLYQRAAVFALSSEEEGLGVVVLEAMSCGTPAVATRCGGPESIITNGVDGFLVNRRDPTAMSERLVQLCKSPALLDAMSEAARKTIEKKFSKTSAGAAFRTVWSRLAANGARDSRITAGNG